LYWIIASPGYARLSYLYCGEIVEMLIARADLAHGYGKKQP